MYPCHFQPIQQFCPCVFTTSLVDPRRCVCAAYVFSCTVCVPKRLTITRGVYRAHANRSCRSVMCCTSGCTVFTPHTDSTLQRSIHNTLNLTRNKILQIFHPAHGSTFQTLQERIGSVGRRGAERLRRVKQKQETPCSPAATSHCPEACAPAPYCCAIPSRRRKVIWAHGNTSSDQHPRLGICPVYDPNSRLKAPFRTHLPSLCVALTSDLL